MRAPSAWCAAPSPRSPPWSPRSRSSSPAPCPPRTVKGTPSSAPPQRAAETTCTPRRPHAPSATSRPIQPGVQPTPVRADCRKGNYKNLFLYEFRSRIPTELSQWDYESGRIPILNGGGLSHKKYCLNCQIKRLTTI